MELTIPAEEFNNPKLARKVTMLREAFAVPCNARGRDKELEEVARRHDCSIRTLRRYMKRIKKGEALVKAREENGVKLPLSGARVRVWDEEAALMAERILAANVHERVERSALYETIRVEAEKRGLKVGSLKSFYRIARKIGPEILTYRDRGVRGLREDIVPAIRRDHTAYRPMECLVGDQHKADYYGVDRNGEICTLELFCWMDFRTQLVWPSIAYKHYNRFTVGQALINACRWGLPSSLYTDWGKPEESNYVNHLREQITGIGITAQSIRHVHAKVRHPQAKPIEGWFSWLDRALRNERIPGYMRRIVDGRANELQQKELKELDRCGELLPLEELVERVTNVVLGWNDHAFKNRGGDNGRTPQQIYQEEVLKTPVTCLSNAILEYVFLPVQERPVKRSQIRIKHEWLGTLTYYHPELANHGGKTVQVRYNPFDPHCVWVFGAGKLGSEEAGRLVGRKAGKLICCATSWQAINPKCKDQVMERIEKQNSLIKQIREKYQTYVPEGKSVRKIHPEERQARQLLKAEEARLKKCKERPVMPFRFIRTPLDDPDFEAAVGEEETRPRGYRPLTFAKADDVGRGGEVGKRTLVFKRGASVPILRSFLKSDWGEDDGS